MANKNISDLPAGAALTGTERFEAEQPAATTNVYLTAAQIQQSVAGRPPGGRLTLTTGTPVLTTTVSGATTVFYTPYINQFIPIWNGNMFIVADTGGEMSQATTDAIKSPAAVVASKNYDVFVWNDNGTFRATRGPPWSSDTARGAGAGTTQLLSLNGVLVNQFAITNGPGGNLGTYVGTIRSNASSTIDFIFGGAASGGTAAFLNVWNYYNRVQTSARVTDNGAVYTYTTATTRSARNSANNRITVLMGVQEDSAIITYQSGIQTVAAANASANYSIGIDVTNAFSVPAVSAVAASATSMLMFGTCSAFFSGLGLHFFQAVERGDGVNANIFNTNAAGTTASASLFMLLPM